MVGVVIVSHENLAKDLVSVTKNIVGHLNNIEAVATDPDKDPELIKQSIADAIEKVNEGDGVLILTDAFGGTPANVSLSFLKEDEVEVLAGVNLPMLLKLATHRKEEKLKDLAKFIQNYGQKNIILASEILKPER